MSLKTQDRVGGCFLMAFGGVFSLAGLLFLTAITLANLGVVAARGNPPGWLWLLFPVPFVLVGVFVFRHGRHVYTRPLPEMVEEPVDPAVQREQMRFVIPFLAGFIVTAVASFVATHQAEKAGAPKAVQHLAFFLPGIVFSLAALPFANRFRQRMARAQASPESRGTRAKPPKPAAPKPDPSPAAFPTVPAADAGPGRTLAFALPRDGMSRAGACGCALGVTLFWNGIVSVFVWQAVPKALAGKPDWFHILFLVPFVLIGTGMVGFTLYAGFRLAVGLLAGRVEVEVSGQPFIPGGRYDLRADQRGPFPLAGVRVELVCVESATYVAGTSKTTSTREVFTHPLTDPDRDGTTLPLAAGFQVPAGAMHSFESANNAVRWKVRVSGRVPGGLSFSEDFAAVVSPGAP